jgi:mono/diheme cytochrome c family protein
VYAIARSHVSVFKEDRVSRFAAAVLISVASGVALHAGQSPAPSAPTFNKDIAPIFFEHCATCHRPGEVAPMSLLSYEEIRPWAKAIRNKVVTREMPPWAADPRFGKFRNDRSLTERQVDAIVKWIDAGAPRGDGAPPASPTFASGWQGGQPDYVFEMPVDYPVPAEGQLDILHFWVPIPFAEDRFVESLELRPGNPAVVHHSRVDVVALPAGCTVVNGVLFGPDGKPDDGLDPKGNRRNIFDSEGNNFHLISYVPGRGLESHMPGTAKRLGVGKYVRFELHYNPNGQTTTDRSKLGVWFSKKPVAHEVFTRSAGQPLPNGVSDEAAFIVEGMELKPIVQADGTRRKGKLPNIPPYAENWQIVGVTPVTEPITLYALTPHMHVRGKDLKWVVTWPDGRDETILSVPKYDFNWQINYELASPIEIPAGSKITAIGHYDNSPKNRYNPAPEKEVYWSDQSWDEMFIPYIEYTVESQLVGAGRAAQQQHQQ